MSPVVILPSHPRPCLQYLSYHANDRNIPKIREKNKQTSPAPLPTAGNTSYQLNGNPSNQLNGNMPISYKEKRQPAHSNIFSRSVSTEIFLTNPTETIPPKSTVTLSTNPPETNSSQPPKRKHFKTNPTEIFPRQFQRNNLTTQIVRTNSKSTLPPLPDPTETNSSPPTTRKHLNTNPTETFPASSMAAFPTTQRKQIQSNQRTPFQSNVLPTQQ